MPLGLYIHIPFCSSICNYCNFNRGLFDAALKDRYLEALEREIRQADSTGSAQADSTGSPQADSASSPQADSASSPQADTIFFGGGTPSLLDPAEIGRLISACRETFSVTPDAEVTLETNPETSTPERMAGFRAAGVNRVSFGVQSFREEELRRLGRVHSADRAREAFKEARAAGFGNISLDLMMWLPQQSRADWQSSVESLIEVDPDHASLYLLELYPNAPLKEDMARAGWSQAPDEDAAEMYLWSLDRLERAGYRQYEISNVARTGRESLHNLKYWRDGEWLGFGCGAHSTRGGVRWKNVSSTEEYIDRLETARTPTVGRLGLSLIAERREMSPQEQLEDALFTGLRLTEGLDLEAVGARYGVDVWDKYGRPLEPFLAEGLAVREGSRLRLSRAGMLIANEILQLFV